MKSKLGLQEKPFNTLFELRTSSPEAARCIDHIINQYGAIAAEWAIAAIVAARS